MACENVKNCTCLCKTCENHSKCCACVQYHVEAGGLPHCLKANAKKD